MIEPLTDPSMPRTVAQAITVTGLDRSLWKGGAEAHSVRNGRLRYSHILRGTRKVPKVPGRALTRPRIRR